MIDWTGKPVRKTPDRIAASVSAVVFDDFGRVLLIQRTDNVWWCLPGGGVEIGEGVAQAVVREVQEETGFAVRVERLLGVYSDPFEGNLAVYRDGEVVHYVNSCFICSITAGEKAESDESSEVQFFPVDKLPEDTLVNHVMRIEDALAGQKEAFIR